MKALALGGVNVRRMLRDRSNIFFVFIFPIALILLIGAVFGGGVDPAVGLHLADDDQLAEAIATQIEADESFDVTRYESQDDLLTAIERGNIQAGVLLPAGMDTQAAAGDIVEIDFVVRPDGFGAQLRTVIAASIADVMQPVGAAQFASAESGAPFEDTLGAARQLDDGAQVILVEVSAVGEALFPATLGRFDLGASQQLILFTFLTALAGSGALILTRQLGLSQRMLSTPTPVRSIVVGESMGRFGVALFQGLYIALLTFILFRVDWGDPLAALLILLTFSAVGAGAGMLMGATLRNDQQAAGIGVMVSLGLAALGGCMYPIELFPPTMQTIALVTPHAWALDGFAELVRRGGNTLDILPQLGVLTAFAVTLLTLAGWRLRIAITRP